MKDLKNHVVIDGLRAGKFIEVIGVGDIQS